MFEEDGRLGAHFFVWVKVIWEEVDVESEE
jgi:hypothetical protein